MKNYKIQIIALLSILTIVSCGTSFQYKKYLVSKNSNPNKFTIIDTRCVDSFTVDSNSDVYVRRLYLDATDKSLKLSAKDSTESKNLLVEVQYLIVNNDKVLYISTIPSKYIYDKTEKYLLKKKGGRISYPNAFFFNTFFFGKTKSGKSLTKANDTLEFKSNKKIAYWNLLFSDDKNFTLNSITNFKIKKNSPLLFESTIATRLSLKNEMKFKNIYKYNNKNYFQYLSFKVPYTKKEAELIAKLENPAIDNDSLVKSDFIQKNESNKKIIEKEKANYPSAKCIYIVYNDSTKTKVKELIIPFESLIDNNHNSMKFKASRVRFVTKL
ncbi:MAG: hypothetical protein V4648_03210 [Bacteroidota bacterium]